MGKHSDPITVGYKYYAGMHIVPCLGPVDAVTEIRVGDRVAWTGQVTTSGSIYIDKPQLFGGEEREGGVQGEVDLAFGDNHQNANTYLQDHVLTVDAYNRNPAFWDDLTVGAPNGEFQPIQVPAYRGVLGLIFKRFYWTALNPYFKPLALRVKRIKNGWGSHGIWYANKATITIDGRDHMNPAHIIYQCIANEHWGMGYPRSQIDADAFQSVADTLHAEGFGLSLRWDRQTKIGDFINHVLDHINAALVTDRHSGQFRLKLIRADYDADKLPKFDESNILSMSQFERKAWGETVNELAINYTDAEDGQSKTITQQNLGNILAQGALITETRDLPGLPTAALAARVCARDLRTLSAPLASIAIVCNRDAYALQVGDVFRLSWDKYGIDNVVFRVADIDLGSLTRGQIRIDAVEDIFGMPDSAYSAVPPSGWVEPDRSAKKVQSGRVIEAPYYNVNRRLAGYQLDELEAGFGFALSVAQRPTSLSLSYRLCSSANSGGPYDTAATASFSPHAQLADDIGHLDTAINYVNPSMMGDATRVGFGMIGDECVEISAIDEVNRIMTVKRGVMDTVPALHTASTDIWIPAGDMHGIDPEQRIEAETTYYRQQTKTSGDLLDLSKADTLDLTFDNRYARPYPPGNLKINGDYFPAYIQGDLQLTWAHRDRTQQLAGLHGFKDGNIGPETGTNYRLRLYGETDHLDQTATGLTGTGYTWSSETADSGLSGDRYNNHIRIRLDSQRDTLTSWTAYDHHARRVGYGYSYGYKYGGL